MWYLLQDRAIDKEYFYLNDNMSFYHAHLSISDLDKDTSQPYVEDWLVVWLVWEIYNKQFLLSASWLHWDEHNYSELYCIAKAYKKLGPKFINIVNGEFAIFIYDTIKKTFYLFRDRWGTNIIYYRIHDWNLYFSSEMKSLLITQPKVSLKWLSEYLTFQYTISPNTIVEWINSVSAGTYLEFKVWTKPKIHNFSKYISQSPSKWIIETLNDSVIRRIPLFQDTIFLSLSWWPDSNFLLYTLNNNYSWKIIAYSFVNDDNVQEIEYAIKNSKSMWVKHILIDTNSIDATKEFEKNIIVHEWLVDMPNIHKVIKDTYPEYSWVKVWFAGDGKEELILSNKHYPYREILAKYKFFLDKKLIDDYNITHEFLNLSLFDYNLQLYDKVSLRNWVEMRLPFTDYELLRYYKYQGYKQEMTQYLYDRWVYIVPKWEEFWFGEWMKFQYHYNKEIHLRYKKLFMEFDAIYNYLST